MYVFIGCLLGAAVFTMWTCLKAASDYDDRNGM